LIDLISVLHRKSSHNDCGVRHALFTEVNKIVPIFYTFPSFCIKFGTGDVLRTLMDNYLLHKNLPRPTHTSLGEVNVFIIFIYTFIVRYG